MTEVCMHVQLAQSLAGFEGLSALSLSGLQCGASNITLKKKNLKKKK